MIKVFLRVEVLKPIDCSTVGHVQTTATNYQDEMKIKSGFALADKSDDIFDIFGTTSINRDCARRFRKCMGLLC